MSVGARVAIGPDPIRVAVLPDGKTAVVASRWARRLTVVEIVEGDPPSLRIARTLDLPFPPRDLVSAKDGATVIVAKVADGSPGR